MKGTSWCPYSEIPNRALQINTQFTRFEDPIFQYKVWLFFLLQIIHKKHVELQICFWTKSESYNVSFYPCEQFDNLIHSPFKYGFKLRKTSHRSSANPRPILYFSKLKVANPAWSQHFPSFDKFLFLMPLLSEVTQFVNSVLKNSNPLKSPTL